MGIKFLLVAVIAIIIIVVSFLCKGNGALNLKKWTFVMIAIFYGIIFLTVFFLTYLGYDRYSTAIYIKQYNSREFFSYFLSVMVMIFGFWIAFKIKTSDRGIINVNNKVFLDNSFCFWNKLINYSILMVVFSGFTYLLYTLAYGGPVELLKYTMIIRNGLQDIRNPFSIFQKFGSFAYVAGYCLFAALINHNLNIKLRTKARWGWLIAFLLSIYIAYSQGGRGTVANIFLVYIFIIVPKTSNIVTIIIRHWRKLIIVPIIFVLVGSLWNRTINLGAGNYIAKGYSYLFDSFLFSLSNDSYRYFVEYIAFPLFFLPQSIFLKLGLKTTNMYNTYLMQGGYKGDVVGGSIITGESTTGFLSFSYYQLGVLGVFMAAIVIGICINKWNRRLETMENSTFKNMLYSYYLIQFVYYFIGSGTIYNFITSNFGYFLFFFGLSIYRKLTIGGRQI